MMKIGLISDTHGRFDPQFREFLKDVDEIWHAGDFGGGLETAAEIAAFKPLIGVVGNCDDRLLMNDYPLFQLFTRCGKRILLTHIGGYPRHYSPAALQQIYAVKPDFFVCGHSHILRVMMDEDHDMIVLNPGAAGLQGIHVERTALRFTLDESGISDLEVFKLPREVKSQDF